MVHIFLRRPPTSVENNPELSPSFWPKWDSENGDRDRLHMWEHIRALFMDDINRDSRKLLKLSLDHINLSSVSNLSAQDYPETAATAQYCMMFNRFFDCLNVRSLYEALPWGTPWCIILSSDSIPFMTDPHWQRGHQISLTYLEVKDAQEIWQNPRRNGTRSLWLLLHWGRNVNSGWWVGKTQPYSCHRLLYLIVWLEIKCNSNSFKMQVHMDTPIAFCQQFSVFLVEFCSNEFKMNCFWVRKN